MIKEVNNSINSDDSDDSIQFDTLDENTDIEAVINKPENQVQSNGVFWFYKKGKEANIEPKICLDTKKLECYLNENYYSLDLCQILKRENFILKPVTLFEVRNDLIMYTKDNDHSDFGIGTRLIKESKKVEDYISKLHTDIKRVSFNHSDKDYIDTYKDDRNNAYVPFKNGVLHITKNNSVFIGYKDLQKHMLIPTISDKTLPFVRNFTKLDMEEIIKSDFYTFVEHISIDKESSHILRCCLGYMLHGEKNGANAVAILLGDLKASLGLETGRVGKSLLMEALSYFVPTLRLDGKSYDHNNRFLFQNLNVDTRCLCIDDLTKKTDLKGFYNIITGCYTVERKKLQSMVISFEQAPKLMLASNYLLDGFESLSTQDRYYKMTLANYYSDKKRPKDEFKKRFFTDWDEKDWNLFDNFMVLCIQEYLESGLQRQKVNNIYLAANDLLSCTNRVFIESMFEKDSDDSFIYINKPFCLYTLLNDVNEKLTAIKEIPISSQKLGLWLKILVEKLNLTLEKKQLGTGKERGKRSHILTCDDTNINIYPFLEAIGM